ncbi:HAD family hydrolase [Crenobacter sp. SG2303]|uniref:HAD family hydrolase n=1 Tax=Crenobacter oryzisoli TaxID=3056844 RepID=A0ABT7XIM8_9NEIS|nr:HAD family hydrolase [Crenobacter sp. SG2303]MDN0073636.1 HAD family hydrolase [Crenobacter sp. SG2303]
MYAAIASDLDGTLLDTRHSINPFTADTLRAAAERNIHLIIATGRHQLDVYRLTAGLDLPFHLITSNGARVHAHDGTLLYAADVPAPLVRSLIQPEFAQGTLLSLYLDSGALRCINQGYDHPRRVAELGEVDEHLSRHHGEGVAKIMYTAPPARLTEIEHAIAERFAGQVSLTYSQPDYLEVMALGVSKGQALRRLAEALGIALEDCAAFGDGLNDYEMLQAVGHPYRMANASPRLTALLPDTAEAGYHGDAGVAWQVRQALGLTEPPPARHLSAE